MIIYKWTHIDRWFLYNIKQILDMEAGIKQKYRNVKDERQLAPLSQDENDFKMDKDMLTEAKQSGYSDKYLAICAVLRKRPYGNTVKKRE